MHKAYCFAGQAAPCPGYFPGDVLPCVCNSRESLLLALSQVAIPTTPLGPPAVPVVHLLPLSA